MEYQKVHVSLVIITLYLLDNVHAHQIINSLKQRLDVDKNVIENIILLNQIIFVYMMEGLIHKLIILLLIQYPLLIHLDIHHLYLFQISYNIQTLILFIIIVMVKILLEK